MLKLPWMLLLALATPAAPQTVHALDKVPGALKTPEAKKAFAQEMEGKPTPDGLGVHLPAAVSAAGITALLVPASNKAAPSIVGARPAPGLADVYIAIVCTGGNIPGPSDDKVCDATTFGASHPDLKVYVGLVEARSGSAPRLIARSAEVDTGIDWKSTILGDAPDQVDDVPNGVLKPDFITSFDLAPYIIAPGQRAFGLKSTWNIGYAGGGAQYGALYLFAVVNGVETEVLSAPMWFSKDIAGDWHKDGTRDHDLTEGASILVVTNHLTNGHFDVLQKARTDKASRLFRWDMAANQYRPDVR